MRFVLFKGKDKLNFLSAVTAVCSARFLYTNDAASSLLLLHSAEYLHIYLIPQHCVFPLPFIPPRCRLKELLCSFLKRKLHPTEREAESSCPLLSAVTHPL